jgi:hypothetical protein
LKVRVWEVVGRCQGKLVVKVLALREYQEGKEAEVDVGWETGLYACDAWNETKGRRMVGYDDDKHTER